MPNEIPAVFYSGSKYDFHLIIKELANEFDGQFDCIAKYTEKCKTFSIPIEKEVLKIDKEGNKTTEFISYNIKFIDSMKFMATSRSNLGVQYINRRSPIPINLLAIYPYLGVQYINRRSPIPINLLVIYPYKYMDDWEKFIKVILPEKKEF